MHEPWMGLLDSGQLEAAWDAFIAHYRRLILAAIRHFTRDHDELMEVFAHACEALRDDDLRRLRHYTAQPVHQARFSTWLVTVVRHLTIDWFRRRDGRRRVPAFADRLPPRQRRLFELVFLDRRSHLESFELLRTSEEPALTFREFQRELRELYRAVVAARGVAVLAGVVQLPLEEIVVEGPDPAAVAERATRIEQALAVLDPEDRLVVELYVIEELPAGDVARVVGLPNAKAVYNRSYRALARLREVLGSADIEREDR